MQQQKLKTVNIKLAAKKLSAPQSQRRGSRIIRKNNSACFVHICAKKKKNKAVAHLCGSDIAAGNIIKWDGGGTVTVGFPDESLLAHREIQDAETIAALCLHGLTGYLWAPRGARAAARFNLLQPRRPDRVMSFASVLV